MHFSAPGDHSNLPLEHQSGGLWEFEWNGLTACTRGRTPEEALEYLYKFPANAKMKTSLPIGYGAYYGLNHAPGWLFRPPVWLLRKMELKRSQSAVGA